jgi:type II secretory pathway component PulC
MPFVTALRRLPEKAVVSALILLLLLLALWLGLGWFSYFREAVSAPSQTTTEQIDLQAAIDQISSSHLFGRAAPAAAPLPVNAPPAEPLNIKVSGVFATTGVKPAYAIVNVDGAGEQAVKAGDELKEGVVLERVHAGHIVLSRGGALEEVMLEASSSRPAPSRAQLPNFAAPRAAQPNAGASAARGAAGQAPKPQSAPPVVNPAAGLKIDTVPKDLQKLGLKKGDVVSTINGQFVAGIDDLVGLYEEFSEIGEVIVEGTRDGKPLKLTSQP